MFSVTVQQFSAWNILYLFMILLGTLILLSALVIQDWLWMNRETGVSAGTAVMNLRFWQLASCLVGISSAYGAVPPVLFVTVPTWFLLTRMVGMPLSAAMIAAAWYVACSFGYFYCIYAPRKLQTF